MNNTLLKEQEASSAQIYDVNPHDAEAWHALSLSHWQRGDIDKAGQCCQRALALRPDHFEVNVTLGNVFLSQGKHDAALSQYQTAIRINPAHPVVHCNLGNIYAMTGKADEAAGCYQTAIQLDPNLFIAFYNLGNLRFQQGIYGKAVNNFKRAIALKPDDQQLNFIKQLGAQLIQNNRLQEAWALFSQLCQSYPEDIQAWLRLSVINGKLGNIDEAGNCCRHVLAIQPDNDQAHVVLGNVLFHHRRLDEARQHYQTALQINPHNVVALNNFGNSCEGEEQIARYIEFYRRAVELLPDASVARATFSKVLRTALPSKYDPWLDKELQAFFSINGFDDKFLSRVTSRLLRLKYSIGASAENHHGNRKGISDDIAADPLFLMFLERTVNTDPDLEQFMIGLRRALLNKYCAGNGMTDADLRVMTALAHQCFNNEYVFAVGAEEQQVIDDLRHALEQSVPAIHSADAGLECKLAVFGSYENLYTLSCREHLSRIPRTSWSTVFHDFLEQAVLNPLEEEAIKRDIPAVGRIEDQTSRLVQSQYEENPYPRWLSVPEDRKRDLKPLIKQLFPDFTPPSFIDGPIQILIAGCGTGKHPIQTSYYNNVEITAIDMSRTSLAYAARMARRYGVSNVQFMQGDILELAKLNRRFHIIECVGVLHHMEDPMAGWRVLTDLLVDGGLMSVGLYSELARKPIVAAREIIRKEGLVPDRKNIQEFRKRILQRELGDTLHGLRNVNDFYSSSECRDLLFHFTEHRYTLPQVCEAIVELKLDFLGFVFDSLKTPNRYRDHFPGDKEMKNFLLWDQFEKANPNTFSGMYKFWCQKNH